MLRSLSFASMVLAFGLVAQAGKYNPELSIGDPAPAWQQLPGTDGRPHSVDDFKDKDIVVVVFTCNSCPYAVDYEDRLIAFAKAQARSKVGLVAINVNKVEEDRLPEMKKRAEQKKFTFPYLFDESQQIARKYGATYTPEFFVLDRQRRIVYMGAMDDSPEASKVRQRHVENAVNAALKGSSPAVSETVAIGCRIRFERVRRRR